MWSAETYTTMKKLQISARVRRRVKIIINALWVCLCVCMSPIIKSLSIPLHSRRPTPPFFIYIVPIEREKGSAQFIHRRTLDRSRDLIHKPTPPGLCLYLLGNQDRVKRSKLLAANCVTVLLSPTALMGGRWKDLNCCPRATFTLLLTASCGKIYGTASFFLTPPIPTLGVFPCLWTLLLLSFSQHLAVVEKTVIF